MGMAAAIATLVRGASQSDPGGDYAAVAAQPLHGRRGLAMPAGPHPWARPTHIDHLGKAALAA